MDRRELRKALQCFCFQLEENETDMQKPHAPAIHFAKGAGVRPAHINEIFLFMQPLVEQMEKEEKA